MAKKQSLAEEIIEVIIALIKKLFGGNQAEEEKGESEVSFKHPLVQKKFLTAREKGVLPVIMKVAEKTGLVPLSKVRLVDVVATDGSVPRKEREWQDNRILRMHLDFAFLDVEQNRIVLAVEVDDSSHNSKRQQDRDQKKSTALQTAEVPLYRVPQGRYSQDNLYEEICSLLGVAELV